MHEDVYVRKVLDHGHVRLVDFMGGDISVVRAARISYDAEWRAGEDEGSDAKLINYLWRHRHTTPFEAVTFTFDIKAPIFVFRQWHRHRTWSYNELSARYKELPSEFYLPDPTMIGTQSTKSKQAREIIGLTADELEHRKNQVENARSMMQAAYRQYEDLLAKGWPRELARSVLPLATYSHMFGTVNLLNLLKFFSLRSHEHAQYEIQVYSNAMKELIQPIVPVCLEAFEKSGQSNR